MARHDEQVLILQYTLLTVLLTALLTTQHNAAPYYTILQYTTSYHTILFHYTFHNVLYLHIISAYCTIMLALILIVYAGRRHSVV